MILPTGAGRIVRDPVVIHVRPLRTNGYAYVYALDRHGRQISDLVTIDDGGIVRKLGTAFYRNCYLDTEPGVHHLQFSMKPGEVEPIALVDPPANTAASIIDLDGYPVLRVIWPAGATPAPLTVRLTNWPRDPTPPPGPDPFEDQYPIIPTPFPGR